MRTHRTCAHNGWLALTLIAFTACGDDDTPEDHDDTAAGRGGSSAAGRGGSAAGGRSGSSAAGSGGTTGGAGGSTAGRGGNGGSGAGEGDAIYGIANTVTAGDISTTYVHVLKSLEVEERIGSDNAREYGGFSTIAAHSGGLLVASAESPTVTRFEVADDLTLTEGDDVDFGEYGITNAGFFGNVFVDDTKAYMNLEQVDRVIWNPKDMTIQGEAPPSGIEPQEGGLTTFAAYDRGIAVSDGRVYQPFYFHDGDFYKVAPNSKIVIYGEDDAPETTLDVPCPALDTVTKDDDGNMIFSIWAGTVAYRLTDAEAPKSCAAVIAAGATEVSATIDLDALAEGRQTSMYRYMKDGIGTLAVYNTDGVNLENLDDPSSLNTAANWELWRVNLEEESAEKIEGLPKFGGGYYSFTIDGRTIVLLPTADLATTTAYEIDTEGSATKLFETTGWTYQLIKIR
ncbi:MAG: MxcI [Polyangiales bacterium]